MPTPTPLSLPDASAHLRQLTESWATTHINERGSFQTWLIRFCEALGVEPPDPPTDSYRFELPVKMVDREGRESTNFIDCWKADHFAMEAKASGAENGTRIDSLLRKAFGQVRNYVAHISGDAPPYLMVVDVPSTLIVWDHPRWRRAVLRGAEGGVRAVEKGMASWAVAPLALCHIWITL